MHATSSLRPAEASQVTEDLRDVQPRQHKLVSIALFFYNAEDLLDETIGYLAAQDYPNLEIVLCDDASTDRTAEIARAWAHRDRRIRYFRNERNLGLWRNPFHAFTLCKGDYFMWAAHDDIWEKNCISKLVEVLESDREAVAAMCAVGIVKYGGELVRTMFEQMPHSMHSLGRYQMVELCLDSTRGAGGMMASSLYRRWAVADAILYVRTKVPQLSVWDRLIPLYLLRIGDIRFVPDRLFYHRLKKSGTVAPAPTRGDHRSLSRRLKDALVTLAIPYFAWRYYWPVWKAFRELVAYDTMTPTERARIGRMVDTQMMKKYLNAIRHRLFG